MAEMGGSRGSWGGKAVVDDAASLYDLLDGVLGPMIGSDKLKAGEKGLGKAPDAEPYV